MRVVALIAVLAVAPPLAHADPWAPRAKAARAMLNRAADAADRGDFVEAAALSLRSLEIEPSIVARWNAGQALANAGYWLRALEQYDLALADRDLPRAERGRIESRRQLARSFRDAAAAADAGRWDDARNAYLAILSADDVGERDRQQATAALDQVTQRRAAAEDAAPVGRDRGTPAEASPLPPSAGPSRDARPVLPGSPPPHAERALPSRFSDTAALVILGTGVIGAGLGAGLAWHGQNLDDQATNPRTPEPERPTLTDRADRAHTGAVIAVAAGGALVVIGAVKLAIAPDAPRAPVVAWSPTTGGALVSIGGRF